MLADTLLGLFDASFVFVVAAAVGVAASAVAVFDVAVFAVVVVTGAVVGVAVVEGAMEPKAKRNRHMILAKGKISRLQQH